MGTSSNDIWNIDFNHGNLVTDNIRGHLEPVLKMITEICGTPFILVNLTDKNEQRTLITYGKWGEKEISIAKNICRGLESENDFLVINNIRDHQEIATTLSKKDLDTVSFYAAAPLKSQSGSILGSLCVFDSKPRTFIDSQKEYFQTMVDGAAARLQLYNHKEAEIQGIQLKVKFKKVVDVVTGLIYELDWDSGELSWGDELATMLGYPDKERFVDYDWWLDKIHPDDLDRVMQDISMTVEGESEKLNLVYRIKTYKESYKHVMNHKYIDRNEDGTPKKIIGVILDISDLKEAEAQAERSQRLLEELAGQTSTAIWIRDQNGKHLYMNQNYKSLFDLEEGRVFGKTVHELFDEDKARQFIENDQEVVESGESQVFYESVDIKSGKRFYKTNIFPISGDKVGGVSVDITDEIESREIIETSLHEKETLIKEIHHRVKNNLAVVSGMMHLQSFKEDNEIVKEKLFASTGRIKTMATIHELLYQSSSFTKLRLDENLKRIIDGILSTYKLSINLDTNYNLEPIELNINQAIPLSLIVNEVVTNVLKHAFEGGESGILSVTLFEENGKITLNIEDDGKGLPENFDPSKTKNTLGLELINTLAKQLKADSFYTPLDQGASFTITFEKEEKKGVGSAFVT